MLVLIFLELYDIDRDEEEKWGRWASLKIENLLKKSPFYVIPDHFS